MIVFSQVSWSHSLNRLIAVYNFCSYKCSCTHLYGFDLILYIIVVINAIESIWKRVNALVPGVVNMDEWLNLFHAVIVVKDPAS